MKKTLLLSTFFLGAAAASATTHTISTTGSFTFSPATVNATVGDTIEFVVGGGHTATEVDNSTWTANGNTPLSGGFNYSSGTHTFKLLTATTHYYVCSPHAAMGMKGQIVVTPGTGVEENNRVISMNVYPNPATLTLNLNISGAENETASIEVYNLIGNKVLDLGGKQILTNGVRKIDITTLPRGVYFLNVIADNKTRAIRFVKE